ncbi:MAG: alpha/beta hydrolase [Rhodospirillaceae bacterium]|mgnify:CR=1 FL=1|nr:alpha/beta hydrolase [Rhodospirillaceae bacterium]|tara:strand:+ start:681 stop:1631 length:951 start_codon:yes stop_codon:yes gene_type:complete
MDNSSKIKNLQTSQARKVRRTGGGTRPEWFKWAISQNVSSHVVKVSDCNIHYLLWEGPTPEECKGGLLFIHGGGGHAHWWSFLAPFFARHRKVAALDLSGMGDSGRRDEYNVQIRAAELLAVIDDAKLDANSYLIGHSFGGLIATKFAQLHGKKVCGVIMVDSPVRPPKLAANRKIRRRSKKRYYRDFISAARRFRLLPEQECENPFLVKHIAHHSITQTPEGWTWKFDETAMGSGRLREPYYRYLAEADCPMALVYGEKSALMDTETVDYMKSLMPRGSPIIPIPEAQHHLTLDQPIAFITAINAILGQWSTCNS